VFEACTALQIASGFVVLLATARENDQFIVRVNDRELVFSDTDPNGATAAVRRLLHQDRILFDTEGAGL
jgi:hypothetical protein